MNTDLKFYRNPPPDGTPCDHPGCLSHISHPCEGCGRVGGRPDRGPSLVQTMVNDPVVRTLIEWDYRQTHDWSAEASKNWYKWQARKGSE